MPKQNYLGQAELASQRGPPIQRLKEQRSLILSADRLQGDYSKPMGGWAHAVNYDLKFFTVVSGRSVLWGHTAIPSK